MRYTFLALIVLTFCKQSLAASYYFSTLLGDDSRPALLAQNPLTPWKTINKLNEMMSTLMPGDKIFFNRGEQFEGSINVLKSGSAGSPIIFSAFGIGAKPIINGFKAVSSWASAGNNLYEAALTSGSSVNMVTINGIVQAMGRYPNINAANGGFLTVDSHNGTIYITDADLPANPNWTGAEIVIRKVEWVLDRNKITNHSGNTITYTSSTGHQPADGNGYFIQNSRQALDRQGEWFYDPAASKLVMYSTTNPSTLAVKASVNDNLVSLVNMSHITFDNLSFEGADKEAFKIQGSNNIAIQHCTIRYTGTDAILATASSRVTVYNNTIDYSNNSGIRTGMGCSNALIRKNTVNHSGLLPGMGLSNNQQMVGIFAGDGATVSTIDSNVVKNSGYCGISFTGDSTVVKNNLVDSFCLTVHDGGGIYTWGGYDKVARKIIGNIVLHGIGQPLGTQNTTFGGAVGIYVDDRSANIEILNNTAAYNSRSGILLHNSHEITLTGNTIFNNVTQVSLLHDRGELSDPIRNITSSNNILFSKTAGQFIGEHGSITNDISQFGSFNNNFYVRPMDDNGILTVNYENGGQGTAYAYFDLGGWSTGYGHDLQSKSGPQAIAPYTVTGTSGVNKFANGSFTGNINGVSCFGAPNCTISWSAIGKLDGGALKISSLSSTVNRQYVYFEVGSINAGTNYLIKFSLQGSLNGKTIKAYVRNPSYQTVSPVKYFSVGTSRSEKEFLFTSGAAMEGAFLVIELVEKDGPIWLDNLNIHAANAVVTNPDDHIRFEYNAGNIAKPILLSSPHMDSRNTRYQGTINIPPFSSVVLIKTDPKAK